VRGEEIKQRGTTKRTKRKRGGGEKRREKREKGEEERVQGGRGAWVQRRVGPHTNNARSA